MSSSNIKKRAANFSAKEETLLVNLVKKHKSVLECKQTDMKTHHEKSLVWGKIENEFNSIGGDVFRAKEVLRKKYDNIKKRVKKKFADEKCYARGTGGGPPLNTTFTDVDSGIKEILGTRIEGKQTEFDDDAESRAQEEANVNHGMDFDVNDHQPTTEAVDEHIEPLQLNGTDDEMEAYTIIVEAEESSSGPSNKIVESDASNSKWASYTPQMLKQKKSPALQIRKPAGAKNSNTTAVADRVSQWAEAKSLLEQSRSRFLEKEHQLKLQFMQEKHDEEIKLMNKKVATEIRLMEEESKAKISIMYKQNKPRMSN